MIQSYIYNMEETFSFILKEVAKYLILQILIFLKNKKSTYFNNNVKDIIMVHFRKLITGINLFFGKLMLRQKEVLDVKTLLERRNYYLD